MTTMTTQTITISNIAGGNSKTFRIRNGIIPDSAIRHARSIHDFGGWICSDPDIADQIQQYIDDADAA